MARHDDGATPFLSLHRIAFRYSRLSPAIVQDISFDVPAGSRIGWWTGPAAASRRWGDRCRPRWLGRGTVMDILNVGERRLQAQQHLTTARRRYAVAIAQLRHSSGTLLKMRTQNDATVEHANLVTAP